jgi:hypothetical protein
MLRSINLIGICIFLLSCAEGTNFSMPELALVDFAIANDMLRDSVDHKLDLDIENPPNPKDSDVDREVGFSQIAPFMVEASKQCNLYAIDPNDSNCEFVLTKQVISFYKECQNDNAIMLYQTETNPSQYDLIIYQKAESLIYRSTIDINESGQNLNLKVADVICDQNDILLHLSPNEISDMPVHQIMHLRLPELKSIPIDMNLEIQRNFIKSPEASMNSKLFNQAIHRFQSLIPCSTSLDFNDQFLIYTPSDYAAADLATQDLSLKPVHLTGINTDDLRNMRNIRLNQEVVSYMTSLTHPNVKHLKIFGLDENGGDFEPSNIREIDLSHIFGSDQIPEIMASNDYILYLLDQNLWYSQTIRDQNIPSKIKEISLPKPVLGFKTKHVFHMYKHFIVYEDPNFTQPSFISGMTTFTFSFLKIYDLKNQREINLKNTDDSSVNLNEFPFVQQQEDQDGNQLIKAESKMFIDEDQSSYYINFVDSFDSLPKVIRYAFAEIEQP